MPIQDIMSTKLVIVSMDTDVDQLQTYFDNLKIHHLIVAQDKILQGIISDRDVLRCISPYLGTAAENERDTRTLKKKAHQIMTRNPFTVEKSDSIKKAARIIIDKNVGCLPVVDEQKRLLGIVTWRDVFAFGLRDK